MPYTAPSISVAGLTLPTYQDILDDLISKKKSIYGDDIYLGADTTDYQELSVFALMIYDSFQAAQLAYNSRSPITAIGSGLDQVVKINGIARQSSSYSTVDLEILGVVGTTIVNGVAQDSSRHSWNLPASVTIPSGGSITVTATAADAGAIQALANTITRISTPKAGWLSVNNPAAAAPGNPVEQDSELRARQQVSTAIAAVSPMDTLMGSVFAVDGVSRAKGYDNDTGFADGNGIPAHSICVVVEGGDSQEIAEAIFLKKTLGTGTYGTTSVNVEDAGGNVIPINFYHVDQLEISVDIAITSKLGYTALTGDKIKEAIASAINALDIGEDVYLTKIIAAASLWGEAEADTFIIDSVEIGKPGDSPPTSASNVAIDFNEVAVCYLETSPSLISLEVN